MVRAKQNHLGDAERGARRAGPDPRRRRVHRPGHRRRDAQRCRSCDGYRTGGTIHVIVNNQIGFTTPPERVPLHALPDRRRQDDPGAGLPRERRRPRGGGAGGAARDRLPPAVQARRHHRPVCYRRHGHNELDEPTFTQPVMYEKIAAAPDGARALRASGWSQRGRRHRGRGRRRVEAEFRELLERRARLRARRHAAPAGVRVRRRSGRASAGRATTGAPTPRVPRETLRRDRATALDARARRLPRRTRRSRSCSRQRAAMVRDGKGDRLGLRRDAGARLAAARGHARPPDRPGHRPRHLQPPPRRAARRRDRRRATCRSTTSRAEQAHAS